MSLLLAAKADPEACNRSGQRPKVKMLMQVAPQQDINESSDVHLIRALALEPEVNLSFLSYTLNMLKTPVRDSLGFSKNSHAKKQAQLSAEEEATGFWSVCITNYTHAGLCSTLETSGVYSDPANWIRSRQALVLTCERLLLFNASNWSLEQVLALSELAELVLSSHCSTVVVLRMHRVPDLVLDVPASARTRFIEELQFATNAVNERWGGSDFSGGLHIHQEGESITDLFDQNRKKVGLLAWLEANVFLFLPYVPTAVLLAGDSFFFGQLDLRQHIRGNDWGWRSYYFALKSGPVRKLLWCKRPTDELSTGVVHVRDITAVQPLDTPGGEATWLTSHESMAVTGTVGIASHVPKFWGPKLDVETLLDRRFSVGVGGREFVWIRRLLSAHNLDFSDLHPLGVQSKRQRRTLNTSSCIYQEPGGLDCIHQNNADVTHRRIVSAAKIQGCFCPFV
eukprot:symbB.v1.2.012939.t1/scaffold904.1/size155000/13